MPTTDNDTAEEQVTAGFGRKTFGGEILTLPSGARVRVRRPGLQALLREGIIDQFDGLTAIVDNETIPQAQGMRPKIGHAEAQKMLKDPSKLTGMMDTIDKIAIACIVEPRIYPIPTPVDEDKKPIENPTDEQIDDARDEERSYVDYVPFEDKMFVMNFAVGGTRDLERFRQESEEALGMLHDGEVDEGSTP